MRELLEKILSGGGKELAGLEIEGVIPIRQELINETIAQGLKQGLTKEIELPKEAKAPEASQINALLAHVKRAEVTAEDGKLTIAFHVKVTS
ncbi:hypothetical protein [Armatimonas sp.]|uniref:hypothetical protein n=1 Tax=Armatimonas sp. TaxID=1872638 RepID=UPI00286BAA2E|nr:hypothetical protein [Armatimonas sp.]